MKTYEDIKFNITVITPVHINNGNVLFENRDFYLDGKNVHRIDYPSMLSEFPEENIDKIFQQIKSEGIRSLLPKPKKTKKSKVEEDWKQILRAKVGMTGAPNQEEEEPEEVVVDSGIKNVLPRVEIYRHELNFQKGSLGKVQENLLDSYLRSFLPGSTLKGAIRTALYVDNLLKEPNRLSRLRFTWTTDPTEADYPLEREMTGVEIGHAERDIFRQICVRDSGCIPAAEHVGFYQLKVMNIGEDKKILWKKGMKGNVGQFEDAESLYWEMILPATRFETEVVLDLALKDFMKSARQASENVALDISAQSIMRSLIAFGKSVVQHELQYARAFDIPFLSDFYTDLAARCEAGEKEGKEAYLPIGSGVPWHGKTVGNMLQESSLEAIRRHFYRYMGKFVHTPTGEIFHGLKLRKGQTPLGKHIRPDKLECIEPFPKTRHVVCADEKPAFPPGWICIRME